MAHGGTLPGTKPGAAPGGGSPGYLLGFIYLFIYSFVLFLSFFLYCYPAALAPPPSGHECARLSWEAPAALVRGGGRERMLNKGRTGFRMTEGRVYFVTLSGVAGAPQRSVRCARVAWHPRQALALRAGRRSDSGRAIMLGGGRSYRFSYLRRWGLLVASRFCLLNSLNVSLFLLLMRWVTQAKLLLSVRGAGVEGEPRKETRQLKIFLPGHLAWMSNTLFFFFLSWSGGLSGPNGKVAGWRSKGGFLESILGWVVT